MKFKKKNILIIGFIIRFIVTILISGGTFAYLKDKTDKTVKNFNTNKVIADITETENNYSIIPGTSQSKDPTVIVETTIPAYVYIIIEDNTEGLVEYEIDKRWTPLGEEYTGVYWLELEGNKDRCVSETETAPLSAPAVCKAVFYIVPHVFSFSTSAREKVQPLRVQIAFFLRFLLYIPKIYR